MTEETKKTLQDMTAAALGQAKETLERTGSVNPLVVGLQPDGELAFMDCGFAGDMMNHGSGKDLFFTTLRQMVQVYGWKGVVIATEAWRSITTPRGERFRKAHPEEFLKLSRESGFPTLQRKGLAKVEEVIAVTAQSPEGVLLTYQVFTRDGNNRTITYGASGQDDFPIDNFRGRQKMFGDLREENLR